MKDEVQERKRQIHFKPILIIIAVIVIMLWAIYSFAFRINQVNISGNIRYSENEIKSFVGLDKTNINSVAYYLKHRNVKVDVPFIEKIQVSLAGRNTINIEITEKVIIGCIYYDNMYLYFNDKGHIVEKSAEKAEEIPLIESAIYDQESASEQVQLEENINKYLLDLSLVLQQYQLKVDEIKFSEKGEATLVMGDIKVELGGNHYIEDKVMAIVDLEEKLVGLKGTLKLKNYNSTKESMTFTKE